MQSLAHVWDARGLTAEEKLLLIWAANSDGGLGYPVCVEWVGMGEFIGGDINDALRIIGQLVDKGFIVWGNEEEETSHWIWIAYNGLYLPPPDWKSEPKSQSRRVLILLDRDGPGCRYCGATPPSYHVDHFTPKARGGADILANLVLACATCNMAKGAKLPEEWQFLQERPELLRQIREVLDCYAEPEEGGE